MKTDYNQLLNDLKAGSIPFTFPKRGSKSFCNLVRRISDMYDGPVRHTISEDTPFIYEITLSQSSAIRISGFSSYVTVTNKRSIPPRDIQLIKEILAAEGYEYVDEDELGPPFSERRDFTEDNLFNRLFGYYLGDT